MRCLGTLTGVEIRPVLQGCLNMRLRGSQIAPTLRLVVRTRVLGLHDKIY